LLPGFGKKMKKKQKKTGGTTLEAGLKPHEPNQPPVDGDSKYYLSLSGEKEFTGYKLARLCKSPSLVES